MNFRNPHTPVLQYSITRLAVLCLLTSVLCLSTSAEQWVIDGQKVLTIHDPAGLRSQIGAVAGASGTASNLTVLDMLTVSGTFNTASATISGSDAGDYAGEYTYAGNDPTYGEYFTNSTGKFLHWDVDFYFMQEWVLNSSLGGGSPDFGYFGGDGVWYNTSWSEANIVMTGTPAGPAVTGGDLYADGAITGASLSVTGDISGAGRLTVTNSVMKFATEPDNKRIDLQIGDGITVEQEFHQDRQARYLCLINQNNEGAIHIDKIWGANLFGMVRYGGVMDLALGWGMTGFYMGNAGGALNMGQTTRNAYLNGVFIGTGGSTVTVDDVLYSCGVVYGNVHDVTISGIDTMVGAITARDGTSTIIEMDNTVVAIEDTDVNTVNGAILCTDNSTIENVNNVLVIGSGMTVDTYSDTAYVGSFMATSDGSTSTTNNRFYFGENSWLYVSGTNLIFRNSAGNIGTVNITY